jgi:hypothetical protein
MEYDVVPPWVTSKQPTRSAWRVAYDINSQGDDPSSHNATLNFGACSLNSGWTKLLWWVPVICFISGELPLWLFVD